MHWLVTIFNRNGTHTKASESDRPPSNDPRDMALVALFDAHPFPGSWERVSETEASPRSPQHFVYQGGDQIAVVTLLPAF